MKPGRQWLVFDAEFFDNTFTRALVQRYGPTGVTVFLAYLCACKTSSVQGRISYRTEHQALETLGLAAVPLVDAGGKPFTLKDFWTFTGRYKQTHRTTRGQTIYVSATGWEQWQQSRNNPIARHYERDRKRRWRASTTDQEDPGQSPNSPQTVPKQSRKSPEEQKQTRRWRAQSVRDNVPADSDTDSDIYKSPGTKPRKEEHKPTPPDYPEFIPETFDGEPVDLKNGIAQIRSTLRGGST